jgi:hypothetical protein
MVCEGIMLLGLVSMSEGEESYRSAITTRPLDCSRVVDHCWRRIFGYADGSQG